MPLHLRPYSPRREPTSQISSKAKLDVASNARCGAEALLLADLHVPTALEADATVTPFAVSCFRVCSNCS